MIFLSAFDFLQSLEKFDSDNPDKNSHPVSSHFIGPNLDQLLSQQKSP